MRPLNFSLFQNQHVIKTVGYKDQLSKNSSYSKVSTYEDAKFFLVLCTAFVNLIEAKS